MGDLAPIIGNSTLFDLSLVQTHNTGSQRMTTTISDNSEQITATEAAIAHDFTVSKLGAATVGRFTQLWAIVQGQVRRPMLKLRGDERKDRCQLARVLFEERLVALAVRTS